MLSLAKAIAFVTVQQSPMEPPGPKGPATPRPPLGGGFSPARAGAGLSRTRAVFVFGGQVTHGQGEAVPRLFPPENRGS
jgi:hypothetical protein